MELFRPTGLNELGLVVQRDLAGWPPRLPEQPIFYPVLNRAYATQIARDWNTKADARAGYVTQFEIDDAYVSRFERRVVGGRQHEELWVPAEELDDFNRHIHAPIRVVAAFFGTDFQGILPTTGALLGKSAREQLPLLAGQYRASLPDLQREVTTNREAVFLHFPFWQKLDPESLELAAPKAEVLAAVRRIWESTFPTLPLPETAD